jgi:hypothetical protein
VIDDGLYAVRGDFPRIVPASFAAGVPAGIERVEYGINLGGFDQIRLANMPDQAAALLT